MSDATDAPPASASARPAEGGAAIDRTARELDVAGCLAAVRIHALLAVPPAWAGLRDALARMLPDPLPPHSAIPLAMTRAAGGSLVDGVPLATAWTVINAAVRIVDDCGDDDTPHGLHRQLGLGRAINYSAALFQLATLLLHTLPAAMGPHELVEEFAGAALTLAAGQDRDLVGQVADADAYVRLVEDKTCAGYRFAGFAGARVAGAGPAVCAACSDAGYHVGMVLQLLDDLESMRLTGGDLDQGKRTFPVWHGLARTAHPAHAELQLLVFGANPRGDAARIRTLLDELDAPRSVLAAAHLERRRALAALAPCPGRAGHDLLAAYLDYLFRDTDALVAAR